MALTTRQQDTAGYVHELAGELARLSRESNLDVLARLLEIASTEAAAVGGPSSDTAQRRDMQEKPCSRAQLPVG